MADSWHSWPTNRRPSNRLTPGGGEVTLCVTKPPAGSNILGKHRQNGLLPLKIAIGTPFAFITLANELLEYGDATMCAWQLTLDDTGEFQFVDSEVKQEMLSEEQADLLLADMDWENLDELDAQAA